MLKEIRELSNYSQRRQTTFWLLCLTHQKIVVETIIMGNSIVQVDFHQTKVGLLPNADAAS